MRPFSAAYIYRSTIALFPYIGITLAVTLFSLLCGSVLGVILAYCRLSRYPAARFFSAFFVHIIRCTPSIVLLFLVFYGLPKIAESFSGVVSGYGGKMLYVVLALALMAGASLCEIMRSAYMAVDSGQKEAAFCCGMNSFQTAVFIIIPQAAAAALPNFCTEAVILLKQGSLAFTIGFVDLTGEAQIIIKRAYGAHGLETYIALALIYWALTALIEKSVSLIQRKLSKGLANVGS